MTKKREWNVSDYSIIIYLSKYGSFGLDVVFEDLCKILQVPTNSKRLEKSISVFQELNLIQRGVNCKELELESFNLFKDKTTIQLRDICNDYIKSKKEFLSEIKTKDHNKKLSKNTQELNDILRINFENELAMKSLNRRLRKITKK